MISIQSNSPGYASKECCSYLGQLFNFSFANRIGNWEARETLPVLWVALFFLLSFSLAPLSNQEAPPH